MGLPRPIRLRHHADFVRVAQQAKGRANELVVVRFTPNSLPETRFGFAVSRRVGVAVVRNRVKRRLGEATRRLDTRHGYDVVLIARPAVARASLTEMEVAVRDAFKRAGIKAGDDVAPIDATATESVEAVA